MSKAKLKIMAELDSPHDRPRRIELHGRDAWALRELVQAGEVGVTPIDNPAPRWSAYVHKLRTKHAIAVTTIEERHDGPFSGTHARYVLASKVRLVSSPETVGGAS